MDRNQTRLARLEHRSESLSYDFRCFSSYACSQKPVGPELALKPQNRHVTGQNPALEHPNRHSQQVRSICHFPRALSASIRGHCSQVLVFIIWGTQMTIFRQHLGILGPPNTSKTREKRKMRIDPGLPPPPPHVYGSRKSCNTFVTQKYPSVLLGIP